MASFQKRQTLRRFAVWREGADGEIELTLKRGRSCGLPNSGVVHLNYWIITRRRLDQEENLGAHQSGPQDERPREKAEGPTPSNGVRVGGDAREGTREEGQNVRVVEVRDGYMEMV
jgi:hypothetical protein